MGAIKAAYEAGLLFNEFEPEVNEEYERIAVARKIEEPKAVNVPSRIWKNSEEAREFAKSLKAPAGYVWEVEGHEAEEWFGRFISWKLGLVNVEVRQANEENVAYGGLAKWNAVARWF